MSELVAMSTAASLRKEDLHASLSDPVLDTMNFLNEITFRYPQAISFAPGRPYDGFFDTEQIFTHLRRYLDHLADSGASPEQVRAAMFQYDPTAGRIRELIASSLREDEDIDVPTESIVVTVGCQEAMLLALRALISSPQDVFLVSSPCYVGITGAARLLDIAVVAVEEREDGFRCADLELAIGAERARPLSPCLLRGARPLQPGRDDDAGGNPLRAPGPGRAPGHPDRGGQPVPDGQSRAAPSDPEVA